MDAPERTLEVLTDILGASHLTDSGHVPDLVARHARRAGMSEARIFLADPRQPVPIRGRRWTTTPSCPPRHPLGTELSITTTRCREQLEPGDRILLCTDGITEARDARGREFGLNRFTDFIVRHHAAGLPVPETLRRLMRAVLDHHVGRLGDGATVACLERHGPSRNTALRPLHGPRRRRRRRHRHHWRAFAQGVAWEM